MEGLRFRNAKPADADALAALGRDSFTETFGHLYSPENLAAFLENHSPAHWRDRLADPEQAVRLAEVAGRPVAYARVGPPSLPFRVPEASWELRQLYVLRPWHGSGIAATLMDWAIAEGFRRGAEALYLSVFVDNPRARRFYERYGFEPVGRYDFMVGTHADEDIVMRLALA